MRAEATAKLPNDARTHARRPALDLDRRPDVRHATNCQPCSEIDPAIVAVPRHLDLLEAKGRQQLSDERLECTRIDLSKHLPKLPPDVMVLPVDRPTEGIDRNGESVQPSAVSSEPGFLARSKPALDLLADGRVETGFGVAPPGVINPSLIASSVILR